MSSYAREHINRGSRWHQVNHSSNITSIKSITWGNHPLNYLLMSFCCSLADITTSSSLNVFSTQPQVMAVRCLYANNSGQIIMEIQSWPNPIPCTRLNGVPNIILVPIDEPRMELAKFKTTEPATLYSAGATLDKTCQLGISVKRHSTTVLLTWEEVRFSTSLIFYREWLVKLRLHGLRDDGGNDGIPVLRACDGMGFFRRRSMVDFIQDMSFDKDL